MRRLRWFLIGLFLIGWAACLLPARPPEVTHREAASFSPWRRTTIGWERTDAWPPPPLAAPFAPHPLLLLGGHLIAAGTAGLLARGAQGADSGV